MTARPRLPPNQQLISGVRWPVVGEREPAAGPDPWTIRARGLVRYPWEWSIADLESMGLETHLFDIHCVTRWSKFDMPFEGVPLTRLLEQAVPLPQARFVSFVARSTRRHSTSLPLDFLLQHPALVALRVGGQPLESIHGGPVRMVIPGKYFYKSVKWLETIELLEEDRLGYWEADAGYHNQADPWLEQRYLAANLSKQDAARVLQSKNFCGRDLRGLEAEGRDLVGLQAGDSLLRNANFRRARLQRADFRGANLSNAHFAFADLRGSTFENADVEGADFAGADLREVDFRVASMFGASFGDPQGNDPRRPLARIDDTTQVTLAALEGLTDEQRNFFQVAIRGRETG